MDRLGAAAGVLRLVLVVPRMAGRHWDHNRLHTLGNNLLLADR